jgi:site-specific DNA-adenine methylase
MVEGRALVTGFQLGSDVRFVEKPGIVGQETGKATPEGQLNYFSGVVGAGYQQFIKTHTTYLEMFGNFWLPDCDQFAWLNPYTGNQHNRTMFTHLVISAVASRLHYVNGTLPRLIEPFVGSGQIYLNACKHGPGFKRGQALFAEIIGGDLNHYVIAAHSTMRLLGNDFVVGYKAFAETMDGKVGGDQPDAAYQQLRNWTDTNGKKAATGLPDARRDAAFGYIYLVNRCTRGSKLNSLGGVTVTMDKAKMARLASIRDSETKALTACVGVLGSLPCSFSCCDFAITCADAEPADLVIMDCPFPDFSYTVPKILPQPGTEPSLLSLQQAGTYGTGDDGSALQVKIVEQIKKLTGRGTTVLVCNFANPELVLAYRHLIATPGGEAAKQSYVFTYKSPSTTSEAYQFAVIPGRGVDLDLTMQEILKIWHGWGGFG